MAPKNLVYRRGDYLAVLGDDSDFWLCKAAQHVYEATDEFNIYWLEKSGDSNSSYELLKSMNRISQSSVLKKVKIVRNATLYRLPEKEELQLQKLLNDKDRKNIRSDDDEETRDMEPKERKKKRNKVKSDDDVTPPAEKKKKTNAGNAVAVVKKSKKMKGEEKTKKEKKPKKPPVDKSDPNWRLKPNAGITIWEKDPLFETKFTDASLPYVSSTAHSRLAIAAVLTKDIGLLKKCVEDRKSIHSVEIQRSVAVQTSALHYAIRDNNLQAIKTLAAEIKASAKKERVGAPRCYLKTFGTGVYNYRSLGIRKIRKLNMSRGGREGNNALTKDSGLTINKVDYVSYALALNVPQKVINEMVSLKLCKEDDFSHKVASAVRAGNAELALFIIEKDMKRNGIGSSFSRFHAEALVGDPSSKWTNAVREASVRKKSDYGDLTPLHCAAINPNTSALEKLFEVVPDLFMADNEHRKLVHYAAACVSTGPLEFLSGRGANLEDVNKEGTTPLMIACSLGRLQNVKFIVDTLKAGSSGGMSTKMGVGGIDRPQKNSWRPLHLAVVEGRLEVVRFLLEVGATADSQLNTTYDKMTPMMLAAANGDLEMVKLLATKAKIEKTDRYRRTALIHATMNGSASVVSYLLARGADPNRADTSGNTTMHYAAAYGWYFCLVALMNAGGRLDLLNEWKLSPLAVAYLKGHIGIAKYLLDQPGVNINEVNDNGDSILLSMMKEGSGNTLDASFVEQILELIDQKGADPTIINHSGKNVLHFLAEFNSGMLSNLEHPATATAVKSNIKEIKSRLKLQTKLLSKFLSCGCDSLAIDGDGEFPLDLYLQKPIGGFVVNFEAVDLILDDMKIRAQNTTVTINVSKKNPSLLTTFIKAINIMFVEQFGSMFEKILNILRILEEKSGVSVNAFADSMNPVTHHTPFIEFCKKYPTQRKVTRQEMKNVRSDIKFFYDQVTFDGKDDDSLISNWTGRWELLRGMIRNFVTSLRPRVFYVVALNKEKTKQRKISAAVEILGDDTSDEPADANTRLIRPGFHMLVEMGGDMEGTDEFGRTRLVHAVISGHEKTAKVLIEAGADVNTVFESQYERMEVEIDGKKKEINLKSYPVYEAVRLCRPDLLELLISNGARIKSDEAEIQEGGVRVQRSPLLCAVRLAAQDRRNRKRYAVIRLLLSAGENADEVRCEKTGNSVLHLAVNGSSDSADQSLELESTLVKSGCNLFAVNNLKRYPLHYAFTKEGSDHNSSAIDPVEIVALLLEAMDGQKVDEPDSFGCTPLHYAAFRGATVSCLLLLQFCGSYHVSNALRLNSTSYLNGLNEQKSRTERSYFWYQAGTSSSILKRKGANIDALDAAGNTPVSYSVLGKHSGCTLMLLQKDAKINCFVMTEHHAKDDQPLDSEELNTKMKFKYMRKHFEQNVSKKNTEFSLFRGIVQNGWLGITYVALDKMERFGVSYARAVEVAFAVEKFQFAKTLIEKQTSASKLRATATDESGSLLHAFADNCKNPNSVDQELLEEVFDLLIEAGISASVKDLKLRSALHYACQNDNYTLVRKLLDVLSIEDVNYVESSGRTPLAILFSKTSQPSERTLRVLIEKGADLNVLSNFPILDHFRRGFHPDLSGEIRRSSPLIVCVVHTNLKYVKLLLELGADVNLVDESGMSPLMHAVKTNSLEIVRAILDGELVDVHLKDAHDRDVIHHVVAIGTSGDDLKPVATFDNLKMLDLVLQYGARPSISALNLARESGAVKIAEKLSKLLNVELIPYVPSERTSMEVDLPTTGFNVVEDAKEMLKILERNAEEEIKVKKTAVVKPKKRRHDSDSSDSSENSKDDDDESEVSDDDREERHPKHYGCNVQNGVLWKDFATLMTKIDVTIGAWGLYNYYRMEIWKEEHKELFILFTNWGRIGVTGSQYQNTPFATAKQAEEEFEKIFLSKSGNVWSERNRFEAKPKRYRLVDIEQLKRKKKPDIKFDLESDIPSELPYDVQEMICDITNVKMYKDSYHKMAFDDDTVPFGQIAIEDVEKAQKILEEIKPLVSQRQTVSDQRNKKDTPQLGEKMFNILEKIYGLSTEYYYLMPKKGFEFTRLSPIDNTYMLDQETDRVRNLLEFETASRFLLAAQFRKKEINPLDYIYAAMGCSIQSLEPTSEEVPFILKYMYNSNGAQQRTVDSIYRISTAADVNKVVGFKKPTLDHQLLWHGTKSDSLISIMTHGLLINPPSRSANLTGRAFGDGIYTSNAFDKSFSYSGGFEHGSIYLLLCDVTPGKMKKVSSWEDNKDIPPKGHDSLWAVGVNGPAAVDDVRLSASGITVPAGRIETREKYYTYGFDEFVIYDEKRVSIRYIVKLAGPRDTTKLAAKSNQRIAPTVSGRREPGGRGWGGTRLVSTMAKKRVI